MNKLYSIQYLCFWQVDLRKRWRERRGMREKQVHLVVEEREERETEKHEICILPFEFMILTLI